MLPPPRDRVVAGLALAVFLAGARAARRGEVSALELRCFQAANGLPHRAYVPVWAFMQLGSLGGALGTGAVLRLAGQRELGNRAAVVGTVAWAAALAVGPTRSYVGAHLPLDIVGGAALGVAIGTLGRGPAAVRGRV
jgi:membrane-associated phospholipid phosphatase